MSAVVSGLVGGVVATALIALANRTQAPATANAEGWKVLRPGWLLNGTIVGCAGLATLIGYVFLFIGSSRADADTQMTYALLLAIAFGLGAIYTAWASYGRAVMWKDDELRVRSRLGGVAVHRISDVALVTHSDARSEYRLVFRDGSTLRLSTYFNGARELAAALAVPADEYSCRINLGPVLNSVIPVFAGMTLQYKGITQPGRRRLLQNILASR